MELTMIPLQCKCQLRLMIDQGNLIENKANNDKEKESTIEQSDSLYSEIPEWLQEVRIILVDDGLGQPEEIQDNKIPKTKKGTTMEREPVRF